MCADPEPMLQWYTTKPQTPRFSSHTFLFWTLPEQLSILHHACVPTPWTNVPRHTTNFNSENFHLTHPCFELCRNNSEQMTPRMSANPEPTFQRYTAKPQTLRFSSHTSLFWTLPEQLSTLNHACVPTHPEPTSQDTLQTSIRQCSSHTSLFWTLPEQPGTDYTTHVCQPILHQRPKTHYKLQIRIFSSHTSLFWTLPEQLGTDDTAHVCQPILNQRSKDTPQNLRPQDFHLTHPSFELCRSSSPYYTLLHHKCEPTHPEPTPQNTLQTSDPNFFISHIPVLNFAGTACHVTPRMWANPSCTNVPEIQHKRLMTQFCKPILIEPPKIHLSKFQCSPYRRQKCRALQEDTVEWKPVCNLQAKNGSQ